MKSKVQHKLMLKALDGDLDDQEARTWQDHVQQHPEIRAVLDEQMNTMELLQQISEVEPPTHLTQAILHNVKKSQQQRRSKSTWADFRSNAFFRKPAFNFSAGFALGLCLLVLVLVFSQNSSFESSFVFGTMYPSSSNFQKERIAEDLLEGEILWNKSENHLLIYMQLNPQTPAVVRFNGLGENRRLVSFSGEMRSGLEGVQLGYDQLLFPVQVPCLVKLAFNSTDGYQQPLRLQIKQNDRLCFEKIIE